LAIKLHRQVGAVLVHPLQLVNRSARWMWQIQTRERIRLAHELQQVRGLMPLLMKQRNGYHWTPDDVREIKTQFRTLLSLCPYLTMVVMPGGLVVLPIFAWWLDRRRQKRDELEGQNSN